MIDALISGKLIKDTELRTGQSGKPYCQFMLSVGEPQPIIVTGISFGEVAARIAKLGKGDAVSVIGSLKPTEWLDKLGETKHGLNITVNNALSPYDIKKRKTENENC
ncbi:MAG: single-stranded DNA-binding protein [Methylococcaceae bacterium]